MQTKRVAEQPVAVDTEPRCWRCNRLLARYLSRPWRLVCGRCRAENASPPA